jgi:lipopolysaccharide biosynthesis glycosyltransferase
MNAKKERGVVEIGTTLYSVVSYKKSFREGKTCDTKLYCFSNPLPPEKGALIKKSLRIG